VAGHRLFALGDATGYVEPFTGEGMAWALSSAVALAPLAEQAVRRWHPGLIAAWTRRHRRTVRHQQLTCHLLALVLRRPWLTAGLVGLLALAPGLAGRVLRSLNHSDLPSSLPQGVP
jgi:flavin-dependent dehydrogenase